MFNDIKLGISKINKKPCSCNTLNKVLIKGCGRQKIKRNKNKMKSCIHIVLSVNVTIKKHKTTIKNENKV